MALTVEGYRSINASSLENYESYAGLWGKRLLADSYQSKYGETNDFYNSGSVALARRVGQKTNCPLPKDEENCRFWPILYIGKPAKKVDKGVYIWRLRSELETALKKIDLSKVVLYAQSHEKDNEPRYWLKNANPKIWSFSDIAVGEVQSYTLYNDNGHKRRIFQNFIDARAGDMVIGYESTPVKQVVAIAKIPAEQDGKQIYFEKVEGL